MNKKLRYVFIVAVIMMSFIATRTFAEEVVLISNGAHPADSIAPEVPIAQIAPGNTEPADVLPPAVLPVLLNSDRVHPADITPIAEIAPGNIEPIDVIGGETTPPVQPPVIVTGGSSHGGGVLPIVPVVTKTTGKVLGAATFKFTKTLKKGMTSDDVKELQERLRTEGFFIITPSIKYFGAGTFKSVKAYQKAHKLPETGFVGPLTIVELNK